MNPTHVAETILVGALQLVSRGTITQSLLALLISIAYLFVVLRIWPYKDERKNNISAVSNLALVGLFICCIAFRIERLIESEPLQTDARTEDSLQALTSAACPCARPCFLASYCPTRASFART